MINLYSIHAGNKHISECREELTRVDHVVFLNWSSIVN
jgi:hypothetical protein